MWLQAGLLTIAEACDILGMDDDAARFHHLHSAVERPGDGNPGHCQLGP
jgi:hypothetical protein